MVETPEGMMTIELDWLKGLGVVANMTLYAADGWKATTRHWAERGSQDRTRGEGGTLAQVISAWTGMPPVDAEVFVEETVSRWRRSSAFERDVKIGRWSMKVIVGLAVVVVMALVGVASLVWLVVSALT